MMKSRSNAAWEHVELNAKLADLKEDHYRTILSLSAMLELLIEKGILTRDELNRKAAKLDSELDFFISSQHHPKG